MVTFQIIDQEGRFQELIHARNERVALLVFERVRKIGKVVWTSHNTWLRKWYSTHEPIRWNPDDGQFKESRKYVLLLDDGKILRAE